MQKLARPVVGKLAIGIKKLIAAANIGFRLRRRWNIQKHQRLPQVMVGAEAANAARRRADESRRRRITQTYDSVADALEHTARFYRRSALQQAGDYIEIWCEKDALAGLMWQVTCVYDVPLMVSRGMPSLTFLHGTAQETHKAFAAGKSTFIYQFGDHDPSGVLIPQTIQRRLDEMCEQLGCEPPIIERVALTEDMIATYNLPTRPTKREGNRHAAGFAGNSVELDALPPRALRDLVQEVIEDHISEHELKVLRVAEESEREQLKMFARQAPQTEAR